LIDNPEMREKFGQNGLSWAQNFNSHTIWNGMHELYQKR
jgi:hypothetical protein